MDNTVNTSFESTSVENTLGNSIILGNNLQVLDTLPDQFASLIYIDPPFNTGDTQKRNRLHTNFSEEVKNSSYEDSFDDFPAFLMPRIEKSLRCLTANGSILIHLDQREVHYIKVAMDKLMGRDHFIEEIIWSFDFGGRSKTMWSVKHNNILWYAKDPDNYIFNYDAIDRIPYMAPALCGAEKAERGKVPTSCLWQTIVPTNGKEKLGYITQKPMGLLNRFITAHTNPGDVVLDYFCGSATSGHAAAINGRKFVMVDQNEVAVRLSATRLAAYNPTLVGFS